MSVCVRRDAQPTVSLSFCAVCGCSCIRKRAALPPRPQVSSYVTTDERLANHKSDIEQLEREQRDVAPSSKRSYLFEAAVELTGQTQNLPHHDNGKKKCPHDSFFRVEHSLPPSSQAVEPFRCVMPPGEIMWVFCSCRYKRASSTPSVLFVCDSFLSSSLLHFFLALLISVLPAPAPTESSPWYPLCVFPVVPECFHSQQSPPPTAALYPDKKMFRHLGALTWPNRDEGFQDGEHTRAPLMFQ